MTAKTPVRYRGHDAPAADLADVAAVCADIASRAGPGAMIRRALADATGCVLAEPVHADADIPPFDKAMMDGFAMRAADTVASPVELALVGETAAGDTARGELDPRTCVRVNTGAPLPAGADAVVMRERAEVRDDRVVALSAAATAGQHVMPRAAICATGDEILPRGVRIGPAQIASAATAGAAEVAVFERPLLALTVTGDELSPVGSARPPGHIYDSNGPSLTALAVELGAAMHSTAVCKDDAAALRARFEAALAAPIVVAVGGMSMGTRDLVPGVLASLGVHWRVHGVNMRPGRPIAYGVGPDGQHVFGLPGNPVSCFVAFTLFVRIAIDARSGLPARAPRTWRMRLRQPTRGSRDPRPAYLPARIELDGDGLPQVSAVPWRGSGDPIGLGRANALLVQPAGGAAMNVGEMVSVLPLGSAMT